MFNTQNGYSLADIAAATGGNNDTFGGNGAWWIIILFLFCFMGGWNNGGNGFLGRGNSSSGAAEGYVLATDFATIERKIDGVNNGLCDGFYTQAQLINGVQTSVQGAQNAITAAITQDTIANMQNTNAIGAQLTGIGTQLQQCCCDLNNNIGTQFANLNYNLADQSCQTRRTIADSTRDIIANQDANTRSILDFLTQDKIATLTAENQSLKFAASQAEQNNYLVRTLNPTPVPAYTVPNPYCNCGSCGC